MVALVVVLGFAVLADAAQLAFIIGAFIAGLAIGGSDQHERIAGDLNSVGGVLIPIFFVLIGVHADLAAMLRPSVLLDAAVLLAIAVAGKLLSAYGAAGTRSDRLVIGIGMVPRGEVGLIFASIGLVQGVLDDELYGALLLVVLLTTVIAPPALRWRMGMPRPLRHHSGRRHDARTGRRLGVAPRRQARARRPAADKRRGVRRAAGRRPRPWWSSLGRAALVVRRAPRRRGRVDRTTTPSPCST